MEFVLWLEVSLTKWSKIIVTGLKKYVKRHEIVCKGQRGHHNVKYKVNFSI